MKKIPCNSPVDRRHKQGVKDWRSTAPRQGNRNQLTALRLAHIGFLFAFVLLPLLVCSTMVLLLELAMGAVLPSDFFEDIKKGCRVDIK